MALNRPHAYHAMELRLSDKREVRTRALASITSCRSLRRISPPTPPYVISLCWCCLSRDPPTLFRRLNNNAKREL